MVIVVLIALVLIVAAFVKKDYAVQREVVINKPKQQVFDYIKYIKNQNNYSVWNMKDPNSKMSYTGTDGTVGFVSAWESQMKDVGKGEQTIKDIKDGERLDMDLHFIKPMEGHDNAYMTTDSIAPNQTKVTWGFNGAMPYPMNIMLLGMNMDTMLGGDLQTGLNNSESHFRKIAPNVS